MCEAGTKRLKEKVRNALHCEPVGSVRLLLPVHALLAWNTDLREHNYSQGSLLPAVLANCNHTSSLSQILPLCRHRCKHCNALDPRMQT